MKTIIHITNSIQIDGIQTISPQIHSDFRGDFFESYNKEKYKFLDDNNVPIEFVEDNISTTKKNVLKGLHGDTKTWKLIQCVQGSLFVAVIDFRQASPTYLQVNTFELNDSNRTQLLIPAGCVNGHLCMSDTAILGYKQSQYYTGASNQISALWNDAYFNIPWPINEPILSDRDKNALPYIVPNKK